MLKSKIARITLSVVIIIFLLIIGFALMLSFAFSGEADFYSPVIIVTFLAIVLWLILWTLRLLKKKALIFTLSGVILSCAIVVISRNIHKSYIDSIPVMEQEANLREYQPFAENTKAIFLKEESTFKIHDSLPKIDGATALYPLYAAFVQAVYPKKEYNLYKSEVRGGTTPEAYRRLIRGEVDLIFCARPSEKQIEEAKEQGKTFRLIPIGREAFVFFVNKKNKVDEITSEQIRNIYSGKITNWEELGGEDTPIKAFQRPEGSGSQTMLIHIMQGQPLITPLEENRVGGMGGIINQTAAYKNFNNAIGYSFLYFTTQMIQNGDIKLLSVDGIYPSKNTIENGKYPFSGDFYAITTDTKNENVEKFIKWILSPQGQYLVEKTGYTSIKRDTLITK